MSTRRDYLIYAGIGIIALIVLAILGRVANRPEEGEPSRAKLEAVEDEMMERRFEGGWIGGSADWNSVTDKVSFTITVGRDATDEDIERACDVLEDIRLHQFPGERLDFYVLMALTATGRRC